MKNTRDFVIFFLIVVLSVGALFFVWDFLFGKNMNNKTSKSNLSAEYVAGKINDNSRFEILVKVYPT